MGRVGLYFARRNPPPRRRQAGFAPHPHPFRAAEVGKAGVGADARAREGDDVLAPDDPSSDRLDVLFEGLLARGAFRGCSFARLRHVLSAASKDRVPCPAARMSCSHLTPAHLGPPDRGLHTRRIPGRTTQGGPARGGGRVRVRWWLASLPNPVDKPHFASEVVEVGVEGQTREAGGVGGGVGEVGGEGEVRESDVELAQPTPLPPRRQVKPTFKPDSGVGIGKGPPPLGG